jgi:hypothetical protein
VDSEIQMFQNALEFSGVKPEMSWVQNRNSGDWLDTIAELKELYWNGYPKLWSMRIHLMRL